MTRHLFKIVWNRKRSNFLITTEVLVSFLVVFCVVALSVYYADLYRYPLGFTYDTVWDVRIDTQSNDQNEVAKKLETLKQLLLSAHDCEEVEAISGAQMSVFSHNESIRGFKINGRDFQSSMNRVTDEHQRVFGIKLLAGRWFDASDDGQNWTPIVINQKFSRELYGSESPIGKTIENSSARQFRVVGLMSDFRDHGELTALKNYFFERSNLNDSKGNDLLTRHLLVKVRPGTTVAFEEKLVKRLQSVAKEWTFTVQPLDGMRRTMMKTTLMPLLIVGVIAVFLMIMVGLGMTGVLWQNVTQRTREVGLRRAKGATINKIHVQIIGEQFVIATIGLAIGTLVVVQLPLLAVFDFLSGRVLAVSLLLSIAIVYLLTTLCSLYPSWLATRVQPAEALHFE